MPKNKKLFLYVQIGYYTIRENIKKYKSGNTIPKKQPKPKGEIKSFEGGIEGNFFKSFPQGLNHLTLIFCQ